MTSKTDIFPSVYSTRPMPFRIDRAEYELWKPFVMKLDKYSGIIIPEEMKMDDKKVVHFDRVLKQKYQDRPKEEFSWKEVLNKLDLPVHNMEMYKNQDTKLSYKKDNMFMTKSFFTFGLTCTNPGEYHVYQTHDEKMLFLIPDEHAKIPTFGCPYAAQYRKKFSTHNSDEKYHVYLLDKNETYFVKENVSYLILTVQKTLFALDKIYNDAEKPKEFKEPTENFLRCIRMSRDVIKLEP